MWFGFHKQGTGAPSLTWPQSVDEALCYGWIDGLRKGVDAQRYKIRFTPRKPNSIWSAVNLKRVEELQAEGRMQPAGLAVWAARNPDRAERYSHERAEATLDEASAARLHAHPEAWAYWCAQPASYRKAASWWVISARKEDTRERRLQTLLDDCRTGQHVKPLRRPQGPTGG